MPHHPPIKALMYRYTWLPIILMLLFIVGYYLMSHEGVLYADDVSYSHYAFLVSTNSFDLNSLLGHTFIHRPAVYAPTAFFYFLFGVNKITATLWPLICTLASVVMVYLYIPGRQERLYAMLFLGLNFYFIYFSNILYPDNVVTVFAFGAALLVYNARQSGKYLFLKGFITALLLLLAFMAKETAAFYLPFLVAVSVYDVLRRKSALSRFWFNVWLSVFFLGCIYLTYYYTTTGNALKRFIEIEEANYVYDNYLTSPSRSYLKRLLWDPVAVMISTGTFIPLVFLFGGTKELAAQQLSFKRYWSLLFLSALACLWFASTSYTGYNPISLDGRMFNILIPPLAIAAATGLPEKLKQVKYTLLYAILFFAAALFLSDKSAIPYALLALFFTVQSLYLKYQSKSLHSFALTVILLSFLIRPVYFMFKPHVLHYEAHQQVLSFLKKHKGRKEAVLLSPGYFVKGKTYFRHLNPEKHISISYYGATKPAGIAPEYYLLINQQINTQTPFTEKLGNKRVYELYKNKLLVFQQGPLLLYKLEAAAIAN